MVAAYLSDDDRAMTAVKDGVEYRLGGLICESGGRRDADNNVACDAGQGAGADKDGVSTQR